MLVYISKAFLTVSFLQRRLVALPEWIVPVLFSSPCPRWSGSGHANSHAKPALGEHKPSAATALLTQETQRGGDFALQKMTAERQIMSLLGTAQSLEVSAKLTDVWTRQKREEYATDESVHDLDLQQPAPRTPLNPLTESLLSTSWILSNTIHQKSPQLRDSPAAIIDLR